MKRIEFGKNTIGPRWFIFDGDVMEEGSFGFGQVSYGEGSVYTGSLTVHNGNLEKIGFGEQDFTHSVLGYSVKKSGVKLWKYIGQFDYRITDWICGDGVLYFVDFEGNPAGYVKGNFRGLSRIGKYRGRWSEELLLPGFAATGELESCPYREQIERERMRAKQARASNTVMIGDSWFEFYQSHADAQYLGTFKEDTAGMDIVDFGIGGTTYSDWVKIFPKVLKNYRFEKIIINLGFNDIHSGKSAERAFGDFLSLLKKIYAASPKADVYVNAVCHSVAFPQSVDEEDRLNSLVSGYCKERGLTFIACNTELEKRPLREVYAPDGLHLNKYGYSVWAPVFLKILGK